MLRGLALLACTLAACGNDRRVDEVAEPGQPPVHARVRLLTDEQYANAVHDLLGAGIMVPPLQTPGTHPHQLIHDDVIAVDSPLLVQYRVAAETIAQQAPALDRAAALDLAERAFRRPLAADERAELDALYTQGGAALLVEAVFQAPSFVYRTELGAVAGAEVALTSHELAAELSFLFLDSIPDEELWRAAKDESILQPDVLERQVDRLLEQPRVRAHLDTVVLDWLGVPSVLSSGKDPNIYPDASGELLYSMYDEAAAFIDDVLWHQNGSLDELLTSRKTYGKLKDTPVEKARRAGVLTQPAILTALATQQRESIIRRGMFVRHKFLCLPDPGRPPFSAIVAEAGFTHAMTESQFSFFRMAHVYCSGCHASIDPAGRALHHFDGIGRWRDKDEIDSPVESEARLDIGGVPREITGAVDLAASLAGSEHVARCVVDQLANHAYGQPITDADAQGVLHARFFESGKDLVEVFRTLATSHAFRYRRREP